MAGSPFSFMASGEITNIRPSVEEMKRVMAGVRRMNDRELWHYLTHLSTTSAQNIHAVLGDHGPMWVNSFVCNHFESKNK